MGWDKSTYDEPCPCGKSTVTYITYSSDWGQERDDDVTMNCDECRSGYTYQHVRNRTDRPKHWITNQQWDDLLRQRAESLEKLRAAQDAKSAEAKAKFGAALLLHLTPLSRNKKKTWDEIRRLHIDVSWPRFSELIKSVGFEQAVLTLVDYRSYDALRDRFIPPL
jgi:hypothetical protein